MVKIKTKKQLNLPQLIEWAMENDIKDTVFLTKAYSVGFDIHGFIYFNSSTTIPLDTMFTVEVEEEITEDTVIPKLVVNHSDTGFTLYENDYINNEFPLDSVQAFYILNNDLTMTLIWRDGKLI